VPSNAFEEHLKRDAIVQVFARMQLEAKIYTPASNASRIGFQRFASSSKAASIRPAGTLRPGIDVGPSNRSRNDAWALSPRFAEAFAAKLELLKPQAWRAEGFPRTESGAKRRTLVIRG